MLLSRSVVVLTAGDLASSGPTLFAMQDRLRQHNLKQVSLVEGFQRRAGDLQAELADLKERIASSENSENEAQGMRTQLANALSRLEGRDAMIKSLRSVQSGQDRRASRLEGLADSLRGRLRALEAERDAAARYATGPGHPDSQAGGRASEVLRDEGRAVQRGIGAPHAPACRHQVRPWPPRALQIVPPLNGQCFNPSALTPGADCEDRPDPFETMRAY